MKKILELYRVFLRLNVQKAMVYRGTYIAGVVGQWLGYGVTFASLYIMLSRFEVLAGWNRYEVLVLYGLSVLSYALSATVFFVPTQDLAMKVRTGELDQILSKPVHPFLYEIMQGFCPNYLSHISLAVAVLVFAFAKLHYKPDMVSMLYLALMLTGGAPDPVGGFYCRFQCGVFYGSGQSGDGYGVYFERFCELPNHDFSQGAAVFPDFYAAFCIY